MLPFQQFVHSGVGYRGNDVGPGFVWGTIPARRTITGVIAGETLQSSILVHTIFSRLVGEARLQSFNREVASLKALGISLLIAKSKKHSPCFCVTRVSIKGH